MTVMLNAPANAPKWTLATPGEDFVPRISGLFNSALLLVPLLLPAALQASDPRDTRQPPAPDVSSDRPVPQALYRPPSRGAPKARAGSGSRGLDRESQLPILEVLAPEQTARSANPQPRLYWYLSGPYPADIEVSISRDDRIEPLLEVNLGPPTRAGVYSLDLARHGVTLKPGVAYRWFVSLVVNPHNRSLDHGMGSIFEIAPVQPTLSGHTALERGVELASEGLWYDAIDTLSQALEQDPGNAALHDARASLLAQVGLPAGAAFDRQL